VRPIHRPPQVLLSDKPSLLQLFAYCPQTSRKTRPQVYTVQDIDDAPRKTYWEEVPEEGSERRRKGKVERFECTDFKEPKAKRAKAP